MSTIEPSNYQAICEQALGTLARRGVCRWIERDELISIGYLELVSQDIRDEALAVTVVRRAMIDAIRRNEVRQRGRQYVSDRASRNSVDGDEQGGPVSENALEKLIYSKYIPPPDRNTDLWDRVQALPDRQREAVTLTYWGGFSDQEAALRMGVSRQAVNALLKRAQKKIREGIAIGETRAMNKVEGKIKGDHLPPPKSKGKHMLLTLQEVARRLGISEKTARKVVPQLPSVLIGKRYRYPEDAVAAFASGATQTQHNSGATVGMLSAR